MSASFPEPKDVRVEDLRRLIENLPEEKREKLFAQLDIGGDGGDDALGR